MAYVLAHSNFILLGLWKKEKSRGLGFAKDGEEWRASCSTKKKNRALCLQKNARIVRAREEDQIRSLKNKLNP